MKNYNIQNYIRYKKDVETSYKRLKQTGFPVFRSVSELENAIQKHL